MNEKFILFRKKYEKIIYKNYSYKNEDGKFNITFEFEIPGVTTFKPTLSFDNNIITNKNVNEKLLNKIIFNIGLVELISYYKCICPKIIELEAGYLNEEEQAWFKKLYVNGLGEFLYINKININPNELFNFINKGEEINLDDINYNGEGNLIPIGGGKDSIVSLELLKGFNNTCFMINPKEVHLNCAKNETSIVVIRSIDKNLFDLNDKGYLNGHTPYSAVVAFISYLMAYLSNKKYIVLSNEGSANEPTVIGTNINHQYSKSFEFENDFCGYTLKTFKINIKYFSLLRPIYEIQIAKLFSKYTEYHKIFRSCNLGSKQTPWVWCCNCPKCLFIFIMLSAFLSKEEVVDIFGENLLDKKELENSFLELIGESETKPFECIGTIDEVKYALNRIKDNDSYLVKLYKDNYYEDVNIDLSKLYYENNVPEEYLEILEDAINDAK